MIKNYYGDKIAERIHNNAHQNAFDFMNQKTRDLGGVTALSIFGTDITYRELKDNIYLYVNKLKSFGLEKGDTISLCLPNVPEMVYYKYAAWILGIKTNLIDPRFNPDGILTSINLSDSKLVVTILDAYIPKIVPIFNKLKTEKVVIVNPTDAIDLNKTKGLKSIIAKSLYFTKDIILNLKDKDFRSDRVELNQDFIKGARRERIKSAYDENMDASIVFTSGTTGTPKGAVLTHDAYNIKVNQIKFGVPHLHATEVFLGAIPFFSAYGSFAGMHTNLCNGEQIVLIPKFNPDEYADLVCKYRAKTSIGVPKYWEDFLENYEKNKEKYQLKDLSFIMNPVTGGDKISEEVVDRINELFRKENSDAKLIVGYGSSETGGPVATTIYDEECYDPKSTGLLFPGVKGIFMNPETGEIDEYANEGELCISDPAMMDRYLNDEEATKEITVYHHGEKYYRMGDLFSANDLGMLYFKGRVKRAMMRPDGHTVHASPIEDSLLKHPNVSNVCVVGLKKKDKSAGAIPTAFVVVKDSAQNQLKLVQELDQIALKDLSERNRALAYTFIEELPYTPMGKVDYKKLESYVFDDLETFIVDYTFFQNKGMLRARKK